jgi:hypothetical protein
MEARVIDIINNKRKNINRQIQHTIKACIYGDDSGLDLFKLYPLCAKIFIQKWVNTQ